MFIGKFGETSATKIIMIRHIARQCGKKQRNKVSKIMKAKFDK